jgi:hypothetical protein
MNNSCEQNKFASTQFPVGQLRFLEKSSPCEQRQRRKLNEKEKAKRLKREWIQHHAVPLRALTSVFG